LATQLFLSNIFKNVARPSPPWALWWGVGARAIFKNITRWLFRQNFHLDTYGQNAITASSCAWSHSAIKRVLANAHTVIGRHSQIMARYNCYLVSVFGGGSSYWFVSKKSLPFSEGCYQRLGHYSFLARNAAEAERLARQAVSF